MLAECKCDANLTVVLQQCDASVNTHML